MGLTENPIVFIKNVRNAIFKPEERTNHKVGVGEDNVWEDAERSFPRTGTGEGEPTLESSEYRCLK